MRRNERVIAVGGGGSGGESSLACSLGRWVDRSMRWKLLVTGGAVVTPHVKYETTAQNKRTRSGIVPGEKLSNVLVTQKPFNLHGIVYCISEMLRCGCKFCPVNLALIVFRKTSHCCESFSI